MLEIPPAELVDLKKKESTRALTSAAVVVADSVLLNKNSSSIFLTLGKGNQEAFKSAIGGLVQLNAILKRALLDFEANLLAHISSHVVNSWANGVIRERKLLDFLSKLQTVQLF